jgi:hypothetical protein
LQDDSVAVGIFEGCAVAVPVGVERRNRLEACASHHLNGGFPFLSIGQIEDQKIILSRGTPGRMSVSMREFEMIGRPGTPQHHAVDAVMIFEPIQDLQAQSVAVKASQCIEIIRVFCLRDTNLFAS